MSAFLIGFALLHVAFFLRLAFGWRKIQGVSENDPKVAFSVIVPVRNEAKNVLRLLERLEDQSYPKDLFEVIIVDDFSEDESAALVTDQLDLLHIDIRLLQLSDPHKQGKKHALAHGIASAKYDVIITTDADCWFGPDWIQSYNNAFDDSVNLVAGPVALRGESLFARMQQLEYAGLIGFGGVSISEENPTICSGANLAFRKSAFIDVGGYQDNLYTPSGDDEFLLYKIMKAFPFSARFVKTKAAIVSTSAHAKVGSFLNQRIRWTSKWKFNKNPTVRIGAVLFFIDIVTIYFLLLGLAFGWLSWPVGVGVFLIRFIADLAYLLPISRFMKSESAVLPLLVLQIIYPLHILLMGINSIFGSYTWKGRKY